MQTKHVLLAGLSAAILALAGPADAAAQATPYIRLADLEIDPAQLPQFTAAIREGIAAAIRSEPDVLALYAVAEQERPNRIRVFEMYTSVHAYQQHLQTPHFIKFRDATASMTLSKTLLDGLPIALGAKPPTPAAPEQAGKQEAP